MTPVPITAVITRGDRAMYHHPETMFELAKLRIAEDLRYAERQRLVRQAGSARGPESIDAVRFRDRLTRLFGAIWPSNPAERASTGA
jgi:hypothetical protein